MWIGIQTKTAREAYVPVEFTIRTKIEFPRIYSLGAQGTPNKFQTSFPAESVPADIRFTLHSGTKSLLHASSNRAPLVTEIEGRYSRMADLFAETDVRNIPRDRLLNGTDGVLDLSTFYFEGPDRVGKGIALALRRVTVNVDQMATRLKELGA